MPRTQDTWRLHRTKANFTDEAFGGSAHPATVEAPHYAPIRAVCIYVKPLTAGAARVAFSAADTFSVTGIKIVDIDNDNTVDVADDAVRTATLTDCPYWTEIRIPMKAALRWGVEFTSMDTPATATQAEVWVREEYDDGGAAEA
jgi:hypothetical protein